MDSKRKGRKHMMDTWDIKLVTKMRLWGILNTAVEYLVLKYSRMVDAANTVSEKLEIEHEFKVTMACHGVVVEVL